MRIQLQYTVSESQREAPLAHINKSTEGDNMYNETPFTLQQ